MKKNIGLIWICIFILLLSACSSSTANNASPEELYKQDNTIDFLVYNDTAYVNATNIDWVLNLELTKNDKLGEILSTNVIKKFKDFDATILEVGVEVYSVLDRDDFVLVSIDNKMVPYYAYVEG